LGVPDDEEFDEELFNSDREVIKAGCKLICPVCSYDRFWSRQTLMNTRCGYIFWFFEE
jgi:hypothetical protein